jgi:hypothetical protein
VAHRHGQSGADPRAQQRERSSSRATSAVSLISLSDISV